MARRRAHQREVARRGSNSFRPTLASVSAERRGAAEMPLCGRTRGAVEVPGCVCVGSCVAPVREAHLAPSQQASRRRVWALSLCRYCVSVLERRREGHWTSNPLRLLTARRRAHRRVARRDSKSLRPTAASVSAERRGATKSALCGRTHGVVEVPGSVSVGSYVAHVREAHQAPLQQASRRLVWSLPLFRYCASVLERRREGHWNSSLLRLLTARRRAHRRVARRDSNSFRPTAASVSAERRGAAEMPLYGRTRGAVVSEGTFECGLRLLCCPCAGALVLGTGDFPISPVCALHVYGSGRALHQQIQSCRGAHGRRQAHYRNPCFGSRPLSRVLWLAPFGPRPLACVLSLASFGLLCPLARVLCLASFGSRPLARVLWLASFGSRPLACVLWLASFGSRHLACFVFWLAPFGSRPLARVLIFSLKIDQQNPSKRRPS
jgi:hypothetical protein